MVVGHSVQCTVNIHHRVLCLLPPCADQGATVLLPTALTTHPVGRAVVWLVWCPHKVLHSILTVGPSPVPLQSQVTGCSPPVVVRYPASPVHKVDSSLQECELGRIVYL